MIFVVLPDVTTTPTSLRLFKYLLTVAADFPVTLSASLGEISPFFSKYKHLILLCGHYEGFDERIKSICDMFISVGDYVLTGGEIPSMIIIDSITRLLDGAITKDSLESESFNNNLLDYPTYTKPRSFRGMEVPEVLISGDHKRIREWRLAEQIKKTRSLRPDLLEDLDE